MQTFADRHRLSQGVVNKITALPATDLDRWEDTDPADWPDEWADLPIPFALAEPPAKSRHAAHTLRGVAIGDTPRGLTRRRFLSLAGKGAAVGIGGGLVGGAVAVGASSYRPLARAHRAILDARAVVTAVVAEPERSGSRTDPEVEAQERRLSDAQDRESDAIASLVRLIARSAGVELTEPVHGWEVDTDLPFRAVATAIEGEFAYSLVAEDNAYYLAHKSDHGVAHFYRPVVARIGGRA